MKALVLAAGKGSRMGPLTDQFPKHMLPFAGKPILEWTIELLRDDLKIDDIVIVTGFNEEVIRDYFGNGRKFNVNIWYLHQDIGTNPGLAAAVKLAENIINEDFVLILGDNLYKGPYHEIIELHNSTKADVTLHIEEVSNPSRYGVVETDLKNQTMVTKVTEKPVEPKSNQVITGFYVMSPKIFTAIDRIEVSSRGELEITDAINYLVETSEVRAIKIDGWRKDVGYPVDLVYSSSWMLENTEDVNVKILSKLDPSVTIIPPVYIGRNCCIKNSTIGPYTSIGSNVIIKNSTITNSVILNNAEVKNMEISGYVMDEDNYIETELEPFH